MSCSPEHLDGCFPVTGLKEIWLGGVKLLLQGQGPFISITAVDSGKLLQKIKVFRRNNVHGFMIDDLRCQEQEKITALVWGGSSLRVIHIRRHRNAEDIQIGCETLEHAAPDWIYDICSAHIEDTHSLAYLITGHNSVLSINVKEISGYKYAKAIQLRHLFAGVKSTLYSANIVSLSPSHILIAAGTVFGEIIIWSCFRQGLEVDTATAHVSSSIHHFFTGHDGSVFGVSISDELRLTVEGKEQYGRLLASCSDDRTVRVWNISDCIRTTSAHKAAYLTDGFDLRSTGFGSTAPARLSSGSESSVAKGWGHASRIWGVYFLPVRVDNPTAINLVSRGEDATCQLWRLDMTYNRSVRDMDFELSHISVLNHHVGKHIWSLALSKGSHGTKLIYTGGNDGAVRKYELVYTDRVANDGETPPIRISPYSPKNLVKAAHSKIHTDGQTPRLLAFVSRDSFVVVYASGLIQLGTFHTNNHQASQDTAAKPQIIWETLAAEEDLRSFASLSALSRHGLAVIGSANGILRLYNHSTKELTEITKLSSRPVKLVMLDAEFDSEKSYRSFKVLVGYPNSADAHLLDVRITGCGHDITQTTLVLTPTFEISTGSLVCHGKCLAIGGKKGQLLLYSLDPTKGRLECSFSHLRAHGKEIVSFVDAINDAEKTGLGYVVTGGADGNYCLYRLIHQMNEKNTYTLQRIHSSLTNLSQIERAYFDHETGHFYLLGFRGARLTLWNETTQTETLILDCGGAHRMWEFMANPDIAGTGTIIWIQARSLHGLVADSIAQSPLQLGNHGREIKSLAVIKAAKSPHTDKVLPSLASGSEDTSIRISQFSARSENEDKVWNLVQSPRILRTHVTGLQQVKWSDDGRFLFSSAGREEFFAWHIRSLPEFGITALMEAACPREDYDSELRVTSFDVLRVQSSPEEDKVLLALVYSNSTVKVFSYTSSRSSQTYELLGRGTYSTNCLTEVHFLVTESKVFLVTGATDGYLAFWPVNWVTHKGSDEYTISSLPPTGSPSTTHHITWEKHHAMHASTIKALEHGEIRPDLRLFVSGGDDNSLSIMLAKLDSDVHVLSSISIANAHASAITAVKLISTHSCDSSEKSSATTWEVASTGNDQQVKIWSLIVDLEKENSPHGQMISVSLRSNQYCPVADIAAMDILEDYNSQTGTVKRKLVIGGVGMEMIRL